MVHFIDQLLAQNFYIFINIPVRKTTYYINESFVVLFYKLLII